jgi:Uma2 family endonuclease
MSAELLTGPTEHAPGAPAAKVPRRYTYAEVCAEFPESTQPTELWDGNLIMSPSPSFFHQEVVLRFYRQLHDWVASRGLGKVITAPIDMVLSEHRVTQPDVVFVAKGRLGIIQRVVMGAADLVCEVISLGGRSRDRIEKRDLYEQYGVKEYWIIDPEARTVEVLHLQAGRYELVVHARPREAAESRLLPGFRVDVAQLLEG